MPWWWILCGAVSISRFFSYEKCTQKCDFSYLSTFCKLVVRLAYIRFHSEFSQFEKYLCEYVRYTFCFVWIWWYFLHFFGFCVVAWMCLLFCVLLWLNTFAIFPSLYCLFSQQASRINLKCWMILWLKNTSGLCWCIFYFYVFYTPVALWGSCSAG